MDPDQIAPKGAVGSGSTLFVGEVSKTSQQTTKQAILRDWCFKGNKCEIRVFMVTIFMKYTLKQHINSLPDFPF